MIARMFFHVAGIWVPLWLPPVVAFVISFFSSMVGVSGAFLLVPFQMSVLGFVTPSVSATNLVFNLLAIPGGVWRYAQEKRVDWRLAWIIAAGTLPGLLAGWWVRLHWLLEPHTFKFFVGLLSLWLSVRLLWQRRKPVIADRGDGSPTKTLPILTAALIIGVVGGAYGIGGGSIMAPVLVVVFGLQLHAVAGAALVGTLVTSVVGVAMYQFLPAPAGIEARPDWALGILFGLGGAAGMYLGARTQKRVPRRVLEIGIGAVLALVAVGYVLGFVFGRFR
jgi:uncharacterized membrane protein YfcA